MARPPKDRRLLLKDLQPGELYRDVLSGYLVLVQVVVVEGPMNGNPKDISIGHNLFGIYFNPIYGTHQRMQLYDRQLVSMHQPMEVFGP